MFPLQRKFETQWLAQSAVDAVDGAWPGSVVLMEFRNREAETCCYKSSEHQAILPSRTGSAISDLIFIDALPLGFTARTFAEDVRRENQKSQ